VQRVLCLTTARTFRTPRSWQFAARGGRLVGGREVAVPSGAWLLDLGGAPVWLGNDRQDTEYVYRLPSGELVALVGQPLAAEDTVEITATPAVTAMNAWHGLEELVQEELGVTLQRECRHLPPFALIKCPLCGGTEFTSSDGAAVWCDRCNARFFVRSTAGDPGFVVDCTWEHYNPGAARYILPPGTTLYLCLCLKDSADPRDGERCAYCQDAGPGPDLTGIDHSLRPGLHRCRVGTLYGWDLCGQPPTPADCGRDGWSWSIDGASWPACATVRALPLTSEERYTLTYAADELARSAQPGVLAAALSEWAATLRELAELRGRPPHIFKGEIPPVSALEEGEHYLLHHWVLTKTPSRWGESESAWPVWYVVRPGLDESARHIAGWAVVRKDICPACARRASPGDLLVTGEKWQVPHGLCRDVWAAGWQPD